MREQLFPSLFALVVSVNEFFDVLVFFFVEPDFLAMSEQFAGKVHHV